MYLNALAAFIAVVLATGGITGGEWMLHTAMTRTPTTVVQKTVPEPLYVTAYDSAPRLLEQETTPPQPPTPVSLNSLLTGISSFIAHAMHGGQAMLAQTGGLGPLTISELRTETASASEMRIRFRTNTPAYSSAVFGDNPYDTSSYTSLNARCDSGGMLSEHCIKVPILWSGVTYYFRVEASSAGDITFATGSFVAGTGAGEGGPAPAPTVTILVNGQTSLEQATMQSYTLTWESANVSSCKLSWVNTDSGNQGDDDITPNKTGSRTDNDFATFTLTCKGTGTHPSVSKSVTIKKQNVTTQPSPPPTSPPISTTPSRPLAPSLSFFVNGQTFLEQTTMQSYTLTWDSSGVQSCKLSWLNTESNNTGDDDVAPNTPGSRIDNDFAQFTLSCKPDGSSSTVQKSVVISRKNVSPFPPTSMPTAPDTYSPAPIYRPIATQPTLPAPSTPAEQLIQKRENRIRADVQENIRNVGEAAKRLRQEKNAIQKAVQDTVSRDVNEELQRVVSEAETASGWVDEFNEEARQHLLFELKQKIDVRTDLLSKEVGNVLTAGTQNPEHLDNLAPVLKSSIDDIELLIEAETGSDVSFDTGSRFVAPEIVQQTARFKEQAEQLQQRGGLALYRDSDNDGVSDFDETNLYNTNPYNAHSAGSALTDGERILLGLNVHETSSEFVPVESPQTAGEVVEGVFEVESIVRRVLAESAATTTPDSALRRQYLAFAGAGLPNSFVTLYIFSTPIVVTVKTDTEGRWQYTLDRELEDGTHELHVAMVDNEGKILAKSPPVPFVQTAEAIEFAPLLSPVTPDPNPIDVVREYFVALSILGFVLMGLLALVIIGLFKQREQQI